MKADTSSVTAEVNNLEKRLKSKHEAELVEVGHGRRTVMDCMKEQKLECT
jgi:hypothetical protein